MTGAVTQDLRENVARRLAANPAIKSTMLAEALGVAEADVLRAMPDGVTTELDASQAEQLLRDLESLGTVYTIVRNPIAVQETRGRFGGFSRTGPFLNVSTEALHLHLRTDRVGALLAVEMAGRTVEEPPTVSFQFFDGEGTSMLKVFVLASMTDGPFEAALTQWRALRERYRTAS